MATLSFVVPEAWDAKRLDLFLRTAHRLSGSTLKAARRREGGLTMDGAHIRTVDPVRAGSVVTVDTGEGRRFYRPCGLEVPVVYEDEHLLVFDKPAGLVSHPSRGHPCDTLANVFAARPSTAGLTYRPLGRLDRDTSGLLAVAKHAHAAHALPPRIGKRYLALLCGRPEAASGVIDGPIGQLDGEIRRRVLPGGREARTRWRALVSDGRVTLALVEPETGRTHQIRAHMAHIGHPLAGDVLYGGGALLSRHALHCCSLTVSDYRGGRPLALSAPPPEDMTAALGGQKALDAVWTAVNASPRRRGDAGIMAGAPSPAGTTAD